MLGHLNGLRIIEDVTMTEPYTTKIKRTFFERLFSLKWFHEYKIQVGIRPKTGCIKFEDALIMHPKTARKLLAEMEKKNA